jgi:hypothetical protein
MKKEYEGKVAFTTSNIDFFECNYNGECDWKVSSDEFNTLNAFDGHFCNCPSNYRTNKKCPIVHKKRNSIIEAYIDKIMQYDDKFTDYDRTLASIQSFAKKYNRNVEEVAYEMLKNIIIDKINERVESFSEKINTMAVSVYTLELINLLTKNVPEKISWENFIQLFNDYTKYMLDNVKMQADINLINQVRTEVGL